MICVCVRGSSPRCGGRGEGALAVVPRLLGRNRSYPEARGRGDGGDNATAKRRRRLEPEACALRQEAPGRRDLGGELKAFSMTAAAGLVVRGPRRLLPLLTSMQPLKWFPETPERGGTRALRSSRRPGLKAQRPRGAPLPAGTMNTIVFNKLSGAVLFEDRGAPERERGSRPYGGVLDSPHARPEVGIPDGPPLKDNLGLRHRRTGARQNGGKVRHKRQALQDMARPLKQWLYKHRDNPYPTKTEKILLALGSQMTLVQVSNWFANARRRLKNTVRQPDLSWALRIKLYNKYVQGNAERLSVSSDDSCSEDGENPPRNHINEGGYNNPVHHPVIKSESSVIKAGVRPESRASEDYVSPPKYKSSLLNRYLNDSLRHVMATNAAMMGKTRQRNHSGSFSSNEFEEELVSPSSSETEGNFVYRTDALENGSNKGDSAANRKGPSKDDTYWKEINAAMALTNLAQGKDTLQGTTSCIIQKSSHIAEVKTVKVPLVQPF